MLVIVSTKCTLFCLSKSHNRLLDYKNESAMIFYQSNAPVMLCLMYSKFTQMITNISFINMHF